MKPANPQSAGQESARGATPSQLTWQSRFDAWWSHHRHCAWQSAYQMLMVPGQSLMMWLVIAIALALPSGLLIAVDNVRQLSDQWQIRPGVTVYLKENLSEATITAVGQRLQKLSGVSRVEYISPQQGLEELKRSGGFGEALQLLEKNPLPPVYILQPVDGGGLTLLALKEQAALLAEVLRAELDLEWVERLQHILDLMERGSLLLGLLLGLGVLLTIGNVTRLLIERRREEIALTKLVGGTDAFVRRPLLYTGFWYGLLGGGLAWLLLQGASLYLAPVLGALLASYGDSNHLEGASAAVLAPLLLTGALLGLAGAWVASGRYLRSIEPM